MTARRGADRERNLGLVQHNILGSGRRRTSMRLERCFLDGLDEISAALGQPIDKVTGVIDEHRDGISFTSAIRVFVCTYFWARGDNAQGSPLLWRDHALGEVARAPVKALSPQMVTIDQVAETADRLRTCLKPHMTWEIAVAICRHACPGADLRSVAIHIRGLWGGIANWDSADNVAAAQASIDLAREMLGPPAARFAARSKCSPTSGEPS